MPDSSSSPQASNNCSDRVELFDVQLHIRLFRHPGKSEISRCVWNVTTSIAALDRHGNAHGAVRDAERALSEIIRWAELKDWESEHVDALRNRQLSINKLTAACTFCEEAVSADTLIESPRGIYCPTCERNLEAFNREIDAWEARKMVLPGDECPESEHEAQDCGLCDGAGRLTAFGARYVDDMFKIQHDRRLRRIADALPGLGLAQRLERPPLFAPGWVEEFRKWDRKIIDLYAGR